VVIRHTIDSGSTTFTLLVPRVEVAASGSQQVQTVGITATHRFSVVRRFDDGQLDSYEVATLTGTATGKPPQVVPEPPWHSGLLP